MQSVDTRLKAASLRADTATAILGPESASFLAVRGRYPDGGEFELDALLLGEYHTLARKGSAHEMPALELMMAAVYRAVHGATPRCCDIFLEHHVKREVTLKGGGRYQQTTGGTFTHRPGVNTMWDMRRDLASCIPNPKGGRRKSGCPLGTDQVRVHNWDIRPRTQYALEYSLMLKTYSAKDGTVSLPPSFRTNLLQWQRFFMGLDPNGKFTTKPFPTSMLNELRKHYLDGSGPLLKQFMELHADGVRLVQKRARKLGVDRALWLAGLVIKTSIRPHFFLNIASAATDYYTLLRMLAPNVERAASPCSFSLPGGVTPRCCIVYAGAAHTDHLQLVLGEMVHATWPPLPMSRVTKGVPLGKMQYHPGPPSKTVSALLERMGLRRQEAGGGGAAPPAPGRDNPSLMPTSKHLTVVELKRKLKALGLGVSGNKEALIKRLKDHKKPKKQPPKSAHSKKTVAQLKKELRGLGSPVSGRKAQLIKRLQARTSQVA